MSLEASLDVAVVGGGFAGLSAALTLVRARRQVVVVDADRPRNAPAAHSHGFLTRDGVPPLEMLEIGRGEILQSAASGVSAAAAINADLTAEDTAGALALRRQATIEE
jgi:glycine/D-amino acid oxidase-like deaminating enzyme